MFQREQTLKEQQRRFALWTDSHKRYKSKHSKVDPKLKAQIETVFEGRVKARVIPKLAGRQAIDTMELTKV